MKRKTVLLNIFVLLAVILAACTTSTPTEVGEVAIPEEVEETEVTSEEAESFEPPVELTLYYITFAESPADMALVQEELDRLTLEKINATVKLTPLSVSVYGEQINLLLSSQEPFDLFYNSIARNVQGQVNSGQIIPLDELLSEYGQGIVDAVGEDYLQAGTVSSEIYAVPTIRDFAADTQLVMRADIVDKYDIDISQIDSLESITPVLEVIYENEPGMAPLVPNVVGNSILSTYLPYDPLGNTMGVLMDYGQNLEVVNLFEAEEYASWVNLVHDWYTSGYIMGDITTSTSNKYTIIENGAGFSFIARGKPGYEAQEEQSLGGMDVDLVQITPAFANTNTVANVMWSIPMSSEHPEKAMEFLNLLYTDKEVFNLITWGIEGVHYVKVSDNVITYPEGVTGETTGYQLGMGWLFGNQFLEYVWEGDDLHIWTAMKEFNENALKSEAMGFVFDNSNVKNEVAAVTNVMEQYQLSLESGVLDPETELPKFIQALKDAGIDTIIVEKQAQLDAWAGN